MEDAFDEDFVTFLGARKVEFFLSSILILLKHFLFLFL